MRERVDHTLPTVNVLHFIDKDIDAAFGFQLLTIKTYETVKVLIILDKIERRQFAVYENDIVAANALLHKMHGCLAQYVAFAHTSLPRKHLHHLAAKILVDACGVKRTGETAIDGVAKPKIVSFNRFDLFVHTRNFPQR